MTKLTIEDVRSPSNTAGWLPFKIRKWFHWPLTFDNRFLTDAVVNLVSQVGFALFSLATAMLTSRALGPSDKGMLALLIIMPIVVRALLDLGVEQGLTIKMATGEHHHLQKRGIAVGLIAHAFLTFAISGSIAITVAVSGIGEFEQLSGITAWVIALACPLVMLDYDLGGMLYGFKRITFLAILRLGSAVLVALTTAVLFVLEIRTPIPYFLAHLIGNIGSIVGKLVNLRRTDWQSPLGSSSAFRLRNYLGVPRSGLPFYGANISYMAVTRLDSLILGSTRSSFELGLYSSAVNLAEVMWYLPSTLGQVVLPHATGTRNRLLRRRTVWATVAASFLAAATLAVAGQILLPLLFGPEFADAYTPMLLLLPGALGMSCARICQTWLLIYGRGRSVQRLNGWTAGAAAALWFVTIPRFGLYAAAVVSSLVYGALGLATLAVLSRATRNEG
jgi:O-antigen/teichoic acid export membrane protein